MYLCSEDNPSLKFPYHLQYYFNQLYKLYKTTVSNCPTTSRRSELKEAPSSKLECQSSVNRCPERTTLYRARLIFGFEHLPPIRGGPLRARKRFNYLDFVFA